MRPLRTAQTLTQPSGTTFYWYGTVNFTHATVTGMIGGGGGGGFYQTIQSNGTSSTPGQEALNFIQGTGMTVITCGKSYSSP
jgi:hypothetical protein